MIIRRVLSVTVLAAAVVAVSAAPASASVNPDDGSNILRSGHCLTASHSYAAPSLEAPGGRISVTVFRGEFTIEDDVAFDGGNSGFGYPTFDVDTLYPPMNHPKTSSLCMSRPGNLFLRVDSKTMWHADVARPVAGSSARVLDDGALVVRAPSGRTVWSSRTTQVLMVAEDTLRSGRSLFNRTYPHSTTRLWMTPGGDLVLRRSGVTVWQSGTHVRGSHLVITSNGRAQVMTPHGTMVWRTGRVGTHAVFEVAQRGQVHLSPDDGGRCVTLPAHAGDCGAG